MKSLDGPGSSSVTVYLMYDFRQSSFPSGLLVKLIWCLLSLQFSFIPEIFRFNTFDSSSINLRNSWRKDDETLPIEFLYTPSDYRIMYTADMIVNITATWEAAAQVVWGHKDDFLAASGAAGRMKWKTLGQLIWGKINGHEDL